MDAFPASMSARKLKKKTLFEEYFTGQKNSVSEVCPIKKPAYQLALEKSWRTLKTTECSHSQAYCWMNCLEVPSSCPDSMPAECINRDSALCCTDTITEGCENMDQSCRWQCKASVNHSQDMFCNGQGTDMYMQGFATSGDGKDACVILLFSSWVLDTRTKFVFGCVGVILLGIAIEGLLCLRRLLQSGKVLRRLRGLSRRGAIIFLFALNIASGYLAMLVAMTYSVELFICMVVGLVAGHAFFNSEAPVGESVDPCCASQAIPPPSDHKGEMTTHHASSRVSPRPSCHQSKETLAANGAGSTDHHSGHHKDHRNGHHTDH